ncbi:MAG: glutamyl-tRNA reductase [Betaproteobacteria bacterium]|nr:glutamyl-tRNA reductase [Betaproteobacteria bacterium]
MTKNNSPEKSTSGNTSMIYCGAHYTRCPVEVRELWAQGYALPQGPAALKEIIAATMNTETFEVVVISTCNRFDLCLFGDLAPSKIETIFSSYAEWTLKNRTSPNADSPRSKSISGNVSSWLRWQTGDQALHQLFRVAASLDSLVIGEPHILGQLKDAYQSAVSRGLCTQEANAAFNRTFQVAKRIRTETDLGKNAISIGHAAVEIIQRVFEDLSRQNCLLLGAGEMARITAQHLRACGATQITFANRTLANARKLCEQVPDSNAIHLDDGLKQLKEYDVIIAATAAQEFVLRPEHGDVLTRRRSGLPAVIVDISVPRNVDPALGQLKNIFVFDIDDLDKVMESSRVARKAAAAAAEKIIVDELAEFTSQRRQRENLVNIGKFHAWVRQIVILEVNKSLKASPQLDEKQIGITADAVAKKLVSHPAFLARADLRIEHDANSVGDVLQLLFKLSQEEKD